MSRPPLARRSPLVLESLEAREVPAAFDPSTGILSVNGSGGDDYLSVSYLAYPADRNRSGRVEIWVRERLGSNLPGGTTQYFDTTFQLAGDRLTGGFRGIAVSAGSGNDVVELYSPFSGLPLAVNVQTGGGHDTVHLGGRNGGSLAPLSYAAIAIADSGSGSSSFDRVYVDDQFGGDDDLLVTGTSVEVIDTNPYTQPVRFSGFEYVEVNAGDMANEIFVHGTPPVPSWDAAYDQVQLKVNGRGGDDFVTVGSYELEVAEAVAGALEVNGGDGDDGLRLRDDSSQTWTFYRVTDSRVTHNLVRDIRYDAERLTVSCGWRENSMVVEESAFSRWVTYEGNGGYDTLDVENLEENWWHLTGYASGDANGTFRFSSVENLQGGEGRDTFSVAPNGGGVFLDASTGEDLLDYSAVGTGVTVNLTARTADRTTGAAGFENVTGGWGNDTITGDVRNNVIRGGGGDDVLYGDAGADVLLGEGGNDRLSGGWNRDLLIGGTGVDELDGGPDDDILVGGTTNIDGDTAALQQVLGAWRGTTLDYGQRVADIRPRVAISYDYDRDTLRGGDGYDWLWADREQYESRYVGGRWLIRLVPGDLTPDYTSPEQIR